MPARSLEGVMVVVPSFTCAFELEDLLTRSEHEQRGLDVDAGWLLEGLFKNGK